MDRRLPNTKQTGVHGYPPLITPSMFIDAHQGWHPCATLWLSKTERTDETYNFRIVKTSLAPLSCRVGLCFAAQLQHRGDADRSATEDPDLVASGRLTT